MNKLNEIFWLFFRLGVVAFGGPAAHIALMQDEVVNKKQWINREHFLDLVGATNLIPGPNSTEMAIHCGFHRGRWPGLFISGIAFILPAAAITGFLAWIYAEYHTIPAMEGFTYGIKPAVIVIILRAVYQLGEKALKNWQLGIIGAGVIIMSLLGINEITALLIGGIFGLIFLRISESLQSLGMCFIPAGFLSGLENKISLFHSYFNNTGNGLNGDIPITKLFLIFLKIGSVLFGSGYVLVAYLEGELVNSLGWLTRAQLLDAIAIGQFTPGPVLSTSTFIGYQISGIWGAVAATVGIFLPSFLFVALLNPLIPRLRQSKISATFLDSVNISSLGLMIAVSIKLGAEVLIDWKSGLIALLSLITILTMEKLNSAWIILGSGVLGYLLISLETIF